MKIDLLNFILNIQKNNDAYNSHGGYKISFLKSCLEQENKQQLILDLSSELQAEVVQSIGHTVILYKENKFMKTFWEKKRRGKR